MARERRKGVAVVEEKRDSSQAAELAVEMKLEAKGKATNRSVLQP